MGAARVVRGRLAAAAASAAGCSASEGRGALSHYADEPAAPARPRPASQALLMPKAPAGAVTEPSGTWVRGWRARRDCSLISGMVSWVERFWKLVDTANTLTLCDYCLKRFRLRSTLCVSPRSKNPELLNLRFWRQAGYWWPAGLSGAAAQGTGVGLCDTHTGPAGGAGLLT